MSSREAPTTEDVRPVGSGKDAPPGRRRAWNGHTAVLGGLLALYLLAVVLGATTSSLGYAAMRQDPTAPSGTTIGTPQGIRSDEWMVNTPLLLGMGAAGSDPFLSPLAESPDLLVGMPVSGGLVTSVVNFDSALLQLGTVLPVEALFAAQWWLPWLLLLAFLPVWLRRVGANAPMSWLATGLIAVAPATAWWSGFPVRIIGFAAAGAVLGMASADAFHRGRRWRGVAFAVLAGLLLSRLASWYVPWSITLAAPVVAATVTWLVLDRERRRAGFLAIGVTAVVGVALVAALYWENWAGLVAGSETVYPGHRRSSGGATPPALLLGGPGAAYFQLNRPVMDLNVSELSSAFTFCAVWAFAVYLGATGAAERSGGRARRRAVVDDGGRPAVDRDRAVLVVLGASTGLWLLWSTVSLGQVGAAIPVLNVVTPERAAQTVGFLAVLVVCLLLSRTGRSAGLRVPLLAATASAAVTAYGVSHLQSFSPTIGAPLILGVSTAVFLAVLAVTYQPDRWRWVVATTAVAALGVLTVNPLQVGAGDLRDSETARTLLAAGREARANGALWATDGVDTDALLMATGVPSLSGVQISGPVRSEWSRIDPSGRYENAWNRGGASIEMSWQAFGHPVVTNDAADQILVRADPCDLLGRGFLLTHVMSRTPLTHACLTEVDTLEWAGTLRYVYETGAGA